MNHKSTKINNALTDHDERDNINAEQGNTDRGDRKEALVRFLKDIIPALAIAYLILGVVFNIVTVNGSSMNPTLNDGAIVVIQHVFYTPERGDIIVCTPKTYGTQLVKRVIGIGGDTVNIDYESGTVYVNDEALTEDYIAAPTFTDWGMKMPVTVPDDCVFVLGDNRNNSYDSRYPAIGFIQNSEVRGGHLFSIFP